MNLKKKIVYVGLAADILHEGHINIIEKSRKLGTVIVGLLTDEAISTYKKLPYLNYRQREVVLKNMKSVDKVIPQKTLSYVDNLNLLKPDFVVHGDDWKKGVQKKYRQFYIRPVAHSWEFYKTTGYSKKRKSVMPTRTPSFMPKRK